VLVSDGEDVMSRGSRNGQLSVLSAVLVGVLIAVIPAVLGYICSFADSIRKDELAFTNEQIEKLYGPLYALAQANTQTWKQFVASGKAPNWDNATDDQISWWRLWMSQVFQPMNVKMEDVIVHNSQLVVGDRFPEIFQQVIVNTEAYKALIAGWQPLGNDAAKYRSKSANTVEPRFPDAFEGCVASIYTALKQRQAALQNSIFGLYLPTPLPTPRDCKNSS